MPGFIRIEKGPHTGLTIGLTEKAGCTSIQQSIKAARMGHPRSLDQMRTNQEPVRIYLRHPIKRFVSAWRYFQHSMFPEKLIPRHAPFEKFVECVLDQLVGNVHWNPQLAMYAGCNIDEIYQFERIEETWPSDIPLKHLNQSPWYVRPPEVIHRLADLQEYYREDLETWASLNET